jgi:hypothetical protein
MSPDVQRKRRGENEIRSRGEPPSPQPVGKKLALLGPFGDQEATENIVQTESWLREEDCQLTFFEIVGPSLAEGVRLGSNGLLSWCDRKPTWECDRDPNRAAKFGSEKLASHSHIKSDFGKSLGRIITASPRIRGRSLESWNGLESGPLADRVLTCTRVEICPPCREMIQCLTQQCAAHQRYGTCALRVE